MFWVMYVVKGLCQDAVEVMGPENLCFLACRLSPQSLHDLLGVAGYAEVFASSMTCRTDHCCVTATRTIYCHAD